MFDWFSKLWNPEIRLPVGASRRSSRWPAVRKIHLQSFPRCEVCGTRRNVEVHHWLPFHLFPDKELEFSNLISLCESSSHNCHFIVGHCLDWQKYNANVWDDAKYLKKMLKNARG